MRIVGGEFRGRPLASPKSDAIRPTADRTRESLFNILSNHVAWHGLRVLDLFAGTGALGFEALSRGAALALHVENSPEGRGLLRSNCESLGLTGRSRIYRRDATDLGAPGTLEPFDLVFADPPYGRKLGETALTSAAGGGWLRDGALAVLEENSAADPHLDRRFECFDTRKFADTTIRLYWFHIMSIT